MPVGSGEYRPTDMVEAATIYNTVLQDPQAAEQLNITLEDAAPEEVTHVDVGRLARGDWPTSSLHRYIQRTTLEDQEGYEQPFHELPASHWPYREMYENAKSPMQWQLAKSMVDQEILDQKMYAQMSVGDWAQYMGWQMVDPISVGFAVATAPFFTMGRGLTVGQAALKTSALSVGEATAIEAVLQITDPLRTVDESILSIIAGGAFGAFLGAGGQRVYNMWRGGSTEPVRREIRNLIETEVDLVRAENANTLRNEGVDVPESPQAAGAAEDPLDMDEVSDAIDEFAEFDTTDPNVISPGEKDERPRASFMAWLARNPIMRSAQTIMLYNKTSPSFSRLADMFSSNNILKHGDYNGTRYNGKTLAQEIKATERKMLVSAIDETTNVQAALRKEGVRLSVDEIARRIGMAARRVGQEYDELDAIKEAGARVRSVYDDWGRRAIDSKVLTKEAVESMDNYVNRLWDLEEIARNPSVFRAKVREWFSEKYPDYTEEEVTQAIRDIRASMHRVNNGEAHALQFHPRRKDPKSGQASARRLTMPDQIVEDFLVSDIRVLANRYSRGIVADVLVRELFEPDNIVDVNGLPMPKRQYQQGIKEYDEAIEALEAKGTKRALRQAARLERKKKLVAESAESFLRQILNRPNTPTGTVRSFIDESARQLRGYAGATQLGAVVQSALPDPANNITQHGMANVLMALPEFFKTLPAVVSRKPVSARRASQYRRMGVAVDNLLNTRMMDIAHVDNMEHLGVKRKFFNGAEVARKAFRFFLADRWNTMVKLLAATVAERAIIRDAGKMTRGKLGKHRSAKMRRIGMTEESAARITNAVNTHGKRRGLLNYDDWDDQTYGDIEDMIWRESEYQVVAPDAGEMPELFEAMGEVGKLFLQYKTFVLSHTMKHVIPATQRLTAGDLSVLAGMTAMGTLAIFSQYIKDVTRSFDRGEFDIDKVNDEWSEKTPMDLADIAVKNSGMLSYLPNLLSVLDNTFNNEMGEAVGLSERKRAYSPGGLENNAAGLGYAYDFLGATTNAALAALGMRDYTAKDLNRARRLIPMQNTFYLQWLFDWAEQTVVDEYRLPEKSGGGQRLR